MMLRAIKLERAAIVVCGLLPLAGILFFGFSISAVVFMLWLDIILGSMRIIPASLARDQETPESSFFSAVGTLIGATIAWLIFLVVPIWIAAYLSSDILLREHHPGGLLGEVLDAIFDPPWWFAVIAGCRGLQFLLELVAARGADSRPLAEVIEAQLWIVFIKFLAIYCLAVITPGPALAGKWAAAVFVATASAALIAIEWHADRWLRPFTRRRPKF